MIIDGRGATLEGVSIILTKDSKIYNMQLIRCDIDDLEAAYPWAENCIIAECQLRSQYEAKELCEKHKKWPCRKCGTKHYDGCRCYFCEQILNNKQG